MKNVGRYDILQQWLDRIPVMFTGLLFLQKYLHKNELFEPTYNIRIYNKNLTRVKNRRIFIRTYWLDNDIFSMNTLCTYNTRGLAIRILYIGMMIILQHFNIINVPLKNHQTNSSKWCINYNIYNISSYTMTYRYINFC